MSFLRAQCVVVWLALAIWLCPWTSAAQASPEDETGAAELYVERLHVSKGKAGDGIVYVNDLGERVKIDAKGSRYKVDEHGARIFANSPRPSTVSPDDWNYLRSKFIAGGGSAKDFVKYMKEREAKSAEDRGTSMNILVNTGLAYWLAKKGSISLR